MRQIEIDLELHRLIENARKAFEETECEILHRLLRHQKPGGGLDEVIEDAKVDGLESAVSIGSRTTGQWMVRMHTRQFFARNLREAYITAMSLLLEKDERIFEKLAGEGNPRRRVVARRPRDLYPHSPHLAEPQKNNWHRLGEWFVDLNLSRDQAAKKVRRACALAGLRYGPDLAIIDGLKVL